MLRRFFLLMSIPLIVSGCSMGHMVVNGAISIMDTGSMAMQQETDLQLAEQAIPANFKMVEGMILETPDNPVLRVYAMQALYGYTFGFVENTDPDRAVKLYQRCINHGQKALNDLGLKLELDSTNTDELQSALAKADKKMVPALFWTSSCWAKSIDLSRDDPTRIAGLGDAAAMMQRVLELDPDYFYGGPHLFFAIYYGARPRFFGGDPDRAQTHFDYVRQLNHGKLLLADVFEAQYLARQNFDQTRFRELLDGVLNAPDGIFPEMALSNALAKRNAKQLLTKEDDWF